MFVCLHKRLLGYYFLRNVLLVIPYNIALTMKYLNGNSQDR